MLWLKLFRSWGILQAACSCFCRTWLVGNRRTRQLFSIQPGFVTYHYPWGENFPPPPEFETSLFPAPEACKILLAILEEGSKGNDGWLVSPEQNTGPKSSHTLLLCKKRKWTLKRGCSSSPRHHWLWQPCFHGLWPPSRSGLELGGSNWTWDNHTLCLGLCLARREGDTSLANETRHMWHFYDSFLSYFLQVFSVKLDCFPQSPQCCWESHLQTEEWCRDNAPGVGLSWLYSSYIFPLGFPWLFARHRHISVGISPGPALRSA